MKQFNRVAIIGVGLIGGSLGLAVRKKRLAREVVGVCRTLASIRLAKRRGAVDWGTTDPVRAVTGSDFVILAAPIHTIPSLFHQVARHLDSGCLVTDVASTKSLLVKEIGNSMPKGVTFVGSHPMAGRETRGVAQALPTLFENNLCFVIRMPHTPVSSLQRVCRFWRALGSRVEVVSAEQHDHLVASLSHLPHLVAALLVLNAGKLELAGTGLKDMTRVVSSDPALWQDIFLTNRKEILTSLVQFQKRLEAVAGLLKHKEMGSLLKQLKIAKRLRDRSFAR